MTTIRVSERIDMAHRLHLTQGNCHNIHGHTWTVWIELRGDLLPNGMVADFRDVKSQLRTLLSKYDHHLLLGESDPLVELGLPGTITCWRDATTEVFARTVYERLRDIAPTELVKVEVWETPTNVAIYP